MHALALPPASPPQPAPSTVAALADEHQTIERRLARLRALAIALTHAGLSHAVRAQAREALAWFGNTTREHHLVEEREVFPALLDSADPALAAPAQRLLQEHDWLETEWQQLAPALRAAAEGQASFDPQVLRHGVEVFVQLYRDHMAFEETHAYPLAHRQLGGA